jgi:hypothetical protein
MDHLIVQVGRVCSISGVMVPIPSALGRPDLRVQLYSYTTLDNYSNYRTFLLLAQVEHQRM